VKQDEIFFVCHLRGLIAFHFYVRAFLKKVNYLVLGSYEEKKKAITFAAALNGGKFSIGLNFGRFRAGK